LTVDFHSHILPGIDDGPKDVETSLAMLKSMKSQGVEVVAATPHFYPHLQPPEDFLVKRQDSLNRLAPYLSDDLPAIILGTEVHIERGVHNLDLSGLTLGSTGLILVELPYLYQSWVLDEVYNLSIDFGLTPVFAHLDRYLDLYSREAIQEILDFDDKIIQINHEALFHRPIRKRVLNWILGGIPVIFGSDSHNIDTRPPQNKKAASVVRSKLGEKWLNGYEKYSEELIGLK